jgi:hypothetical protein
MLQDLPLQCEIFRKAFVTIQLVNNTVFVWRYTEARSCNHCCSGKAKSITQVVCAFVALVIQHAMSMRHIIICGLHHSNNIFPHYLKKARFSKNKSLNIKFVFRVSLQLLSEIFIILRSNERDVIRNVHVKYTLFLSDFNVTCIFSTYFRNMLKITHFMKIRPLGAQLFHADGQAWRS